MNHYRLIVTAKADKDERLVYKYIEEKFGKVYADNSGKKYSFFLKLYANIPS